jgi:hypothetical protein
MYPDYFRLVLQSRQAIRQSRALLEQTRHICERSREVIDESLELLHDAAQQSAALEVIVPGSKRNERRRTNATGIETLAGGGGAPAHTGGGVMIRP